MVDLKHIPSLPTEDQAVPEVQQVQQVQNSSARVDLKHIPSLPTEDQAVHEVQQVQNSSTRVVLKHNSIPFY